MDSQASFAMTTTNTCSLKLQAPYSQATPWGWPDGLDHNSRIPLYKSSIQEFLRTSFSLEQGSTRVHKNVPQALEVLKPYCKESEGIQGSVAAFLQDSPSKNFFPTSRLTQERRKFLYWWATYEKSIKICHQVFCPTICSIQGKRRIFMRQATYEGSVTCVQNQEFLVWFTSIGVQKPPILVEVLAPAFLFYKEAMCEGSFGNGLLHTAKAVP